MPLTPARYAARNPGRSSLARPAPVPANAARPFDAKTIDLHAASLNKYETAPYLDPFVASIAGVLAASTQEQLSPPPSVKPNAFDIGAMAMPVTASRSLPNVVSAHAPLVAAAGARFNESGLTPSAEPHWLVRVVKIAGLVAAAWLAAVVLLIAAYRFVDPPLSALMVQQRLSGQDIIQDWVAIEDVAPPVVRAVLLSEDGRFCQHSGVDFEEMQNAIERAGDGAPRGASTISMQVAKNLFLWPSKSYVRKAIEIPLTFVIETLWTKRRIMEVYLNIAEWGPGIFGVEAASQFHFSKSASRLNEREAARLAVALPNPFARDAGDPGPRTQRLAGDIQGRMRASSASQTSCVTRGW